MFRKQNSKKSHFFYILIFYMFSPAMSPLKLATGTIEYLQSEECNQWPIIGTFISMLLHFKSGQLDPWLQYVTFCFMSMCVCSCVHVHVCTHCGLVDLLFSKDFHTFENLTWNILHNDYFYFWYFKYILNTFVLLLKYMLLLLCQIGVVSRLQAKDRWRNVHYCTLCTCNITY